MKTLRSTCGILGTLAILLVLVTSRACLADKASDDYKGDLERSLERAWTQKGHTLGQAPSLRFNINKDGSVSDLEMHRSSGDPALDNEGLEVVKSLAPFRSPPEGVKKIGTIFGEIPFGPYMSAMQRKIHKNWLWPKDKKTGPITVSFQINDDGSISDPKLEKPSGIKAADRAALEAVRKSAPFNPLPEGAVVADMQYTFDFAR